MHRTVLRPAATPLAVDAASQQMGRPAVAGGSAQREFERRKAKRHEAVRSRHPRIGALLLTVTEEPQATTNWAKGAEGERRLGAALDNLSGRGVLMLHDRRRPGGTANIDHLAVAPFRRLGDRRQALLGSGGQEGRRRVVLFHIATRARRAPAAGDIGGGLDRRPCSWTLGCTADSRNERWTDFGSAMTSTPLSLQPVDNSTDS